MGTMNLSFSIIVPIYKTKLEQLDECLKSLLVQDKNLLKEIILVNDGNTDEYKKQLLGLVTHTENNTHTHTHTRN